MNGDTSTASDDADLDPDDVDEDVRDSVRDASPDPHAPYDPLQPFEANGYVIDRDAGRTEVRFRRGSGRNEKVVTVTLPVAIDPKARIRDGDVVAGVYLHLIEKSGIKREVFVKSEDMGGRDLYGKILRATGFPFEEREHLRLVQRLLILATTHEGLKSFAVLSSPCWDGDRLLVPGVTHLPAFGADMKIHQHYGPEMLSWAPRLDPGPDEDAKDAWRTILEYGARYPKLGLVIGFALSSVYLERLHVPGRTVHIGGVTTKGKTCSARIAAAAVGNPRDNDHLFGTWDSTGNAIIGRLAGSGGMPYVLDETSVVSGHEEENLERIPYAVAEGTERARLNQVAELRAGRYFRLNVISTGERDLATSKGGAYARVVQLNAPLIEGDDGAALVDMLHGLALAFSGWPLWWLVKSDWAPREEQLPDVHFDSSVAQRHARSLAAAKLAFDRVARGLFKQTGQEPPVLDLLAATCDLVESIDEEGSDADKLFEALWSDFVVRPSAYRGEAFLGELAGRDLGETWVVTTKRVQRIAKEAGIADIRPPMRELAKTGRVKRGTKGRGNRARKALEPGGSVVDVYELVKPADAAVVSDQVSDESEDRTPREWDG